MRSALIAVIAVISAANSAIGAFTVTQTASVTAQGSDVVGTPNVTTGGTATFSWTGTPYTGYVEFVAAGASSFDFSLTNYTYTSPSNNAQISAFTLDLIDNVGGIIQRFTTTTSTFINGSVSPIKHNGQADLIGKLNSTSPNTVAEPGDLLLSGLPVGKYRLGLYDSSSPVIGTAVFQLTAVPEIASLGTWALAGMVGTAWMRRSR